MNMVRYHDLEGVGDHVMMWITLCILPILFLPEDATIKVTAAVHENEGVNELYNFELAAI